jgi:release factor glutamine methyltransferase
VAVHRRIAEGAARWLVPGGHLLIESSIEQAPVTAAAMQEAGFTTTISHDEDVEGTVVSGCGAGPAA